MATIKRHDPPPMDWSKFAIYAPRYTSIPDDIFDWCMAYLTGPEFKCLMYAARRTFGFKKEQDDIGIDQFCNGIRKADGTTLDLGTGLAASTVSEAIKGLVEKGLLVATKNGGKPGGGGAPTTYRIPVHHSPERMVPFANDKTTIRPSEAYHSPERKHKKQLPKKQNTQETVEGEQTPLPPPRVSTATTAPSLETETLSFQENDSGKGVVVDPDPPGQAGLEFDAFLDYWQENVKPVAPYQMGRFATEYHRARKRVGHDQMMGCLRWKVQTDPGIRSRATFAPRYVEEDIPDWQKWLKNPIGHDTYGRGVKLRTSMVGCGPTLPEPEDIDLPICWHCDIAKGGEHRPTCPHRLTNPIVQGDEPRVA